MRIWSTVAASLVASSCAFGQTGLLQLLERTPIVDKFDRDRDGRLNATERAQARRWLREESRIAARRRAMGFTRVPPAVPNREPAILPGDVDQHPESELYAPHTLRTLFLYFKQPDWFEELAEFYRTDVETPATLAVDGKLLRGVGVRFRGSSSYLLTGSSRKKSFNLSLDYTEPSQRLYGHRTLNLLNLNSDASFLREVLFAHVARQFVPTPRVNFVRLVINGESYGIYASAQQFNTDFLKDQFATRKGVRWKIKRNYRGVGALRYLGDDPKRYEEWFVGKGGDEQRMARLIRLCRLLNQTPPEKAESVLPAVLDIDRALWFVALENAFMDADGYLRQGYDYRLYEDKFGRFVPIPYDNNECLPATKAASRAALGQLSLDVATSPLAQSDNPQRPLVHRLLAVPAWRARYLAHLRHIAVEWLDWKNIAPVCRRYRDLIRDDVLADDKKLATDEAFAASLEKRHVERRRTMRPLRELFEKRRQNLLSDSALKGAWPNVRVLERLPTNGAGLRVTARIGGGPGQTVPVQQVILWFTRSRGRPYRSVVMHDDGKHGDGAANDGVYAAATSEIGIGRPVWFYVEARTAASIGRTAFDPPYAEANPHVHIVRR